MRRYELDDLLGLPVIYCERTGQAGKVEKRAAIVKGWAMSFQTGKAKVELAVFGTGVYEPSVRGLACVPFWDDLSPEEQAGEARFWYEYPGFMSTPQRETPNKASFEAEALRPIREGKAVLASDIATPPAGPPPLVVHDEQGGVDYLATHLLNKSEQQQFEELEKEEAKEKGSALIASDVKAIGETLDNKAAADQAVLERPLV